MLRLFLFLLLTTVYGYSFAQNGSYTRCSDGIILSHNNDYHVVFPGKPGPDKSGLNGYGADQLVTKNKIWLFFDPPSTGIINIKTTATSSSFSTYIFKEMSGDICSDFQKQKAQLLVFESEKKELEDINLYLQKGVRYAVVLVGEDILTALLSFGFIIICSFFFLLQNPVNFYNLKTDIRILVLVYQGTLI